MSVLKDTILRQFNTAWELLQYNLQNITDEECIWQPGHRGLTVRKKKGEWVADWPESEAYSIGPPNIAWLTWHIIFWWSMALNHSFSDGQLSHEKIRWPGNIKAAAAQIDSLQKEWVDKLGGISDEDLLSTARTKWPLQGKPFCDLAAWLNIELMKNAAEIGFCRFLYASRE